MIPFPHLRRNLDIALYVCISLRVCGGLWGDGALALLAKICRTELILLGQIQVTNLQNTRHGPLN